MQQSFAMFPSPGAFQQPLQQPLNTTTLDYQQPLNFTILDCIVPNALHLPIYYTNRPSLLSFISDKYLALAGPILIYWVVALGFHTLDTAKIPYFEAKRLHESPEVLSRNKATVLEVLKAVFWQQVIQIIMALVALDDDETIAKRENGRGHLGEMERIAPWVADVTLVVLGRRSGEDLLRRHGESMVRWVYWWGIPAAQMFFAL